MVASCERSERPATTEEIAAVPSLRSERLGCSLVFAAPFLIGSYPLFTRLEGTWGALLGVTTLAVAGLVFAGVWRDWTGMKRGHDRDAQTGVVEILTIRGARAVEIFGDHSSAMPAFAFELEGERTLLLMGPELQDPPTFGGKWSDLNEEQEEERDNYANMLLPPLAFPTTDFRLHRWPGSGHILRIEPLGDYLAPTPDTEETLLHLLTGIPSQVLDGTLEDLADLPDQGQAGHG